PTVVSPFSFIPIAIPATKKPRSDSRNSTRLTRSFPIPSGARSMTASVTRPSRGRRVRADSAVSTSARASRKFSPTSLAIFSAPAADARVRAPGAATTCGQCRGEGMIISDPCPKCQGQGRIRKHESLAVKIPPGVDNGSRLKLRGEGEAGYGGGPQGDLYVVIHVKEHPMFVRQDNDVIIEAPISFPQAAVGTEIEVPTLEGKVKLKIPPATQSGKILRLKGKGIVDLHGYGRGDQLIKIIVETPRSLTPRQRELLEEFAKLDGKAVNHPLSKGFVDKLKEMFG